MLLGTFLVGASGWSSEVWRGPLLVAGTGFFLGANAWLEARKNPKRHLPKRQIAWYEAYHKQPIWEIDDDDLEKADAVRNLATGLIIRALREEASAIRMRAGAFSVHFEFFAQDQWHDCGNDLAVMWPSLKLFFCWMSNTEPNLHFSESPEWALTPILYGIGLNSSLAPSEILIFHDGQAGSLTVFKDPEGMLDGLCITLEFPQEDTPAN